MRKPLSLLLALASVSVQANSPIECAQFEPSQLSRVRYEAPEVSEPNTCGLEVQTRHCQDGQLSPWQGQYKFTSCKVNNESVLPLIEIEELVYQGGFRLSANRYGADYAASLSYAQGVMTYNKQNHSLFIAGHAHQNQIAEFAIPDITKSRDIKDFVVGDRVIQPFVSVSNKDKIDLSVSTFRVNGMEMIDDKLIVTYMDPRNVNGNNPYNSVVIANANDLANSQLHGPYQIAGALHASGWVSAIPKEWQQQLGGTHLSGASASTFIWHESQGPTANVFNPTGSMLEGQVTTSVASTSVLQFTYKNVLEEAHLHSSKLSNSAILFNQDLLNELWTVTSQASYGFIIPNTSTYLTLGYSSGHEFGIGQGIRQDTGKHCHGACPYVAADEYPFFWLWDVNELIAVKQGLKTPSQVMPYQYGKFDLPFGVQISGGAYDETTESLYVSVTHGDTVPKYARPPVFFKYQLQSLTTEPDFQDCEQAKHGERLSRTYFAALDVPFGQVCQSEVQTSVCLDGQMSPWTGQFQYPSCTVLPEDPVVTPPFEAKLVGIDVLEYQGGFRISGLRFGEERWGSANYSQGMFAYNPDNHSIFLAGHPYAGTIGEFEIPKPLSSSSNIADFPVISTARQAFSNFYQTDRVDTGISDYFRYTGFSYMDGKLIANYINWYDAGGRETDTSIVIQNANDLKNSIVNGPYQLDGAAHSSGWITEIPERWQSYFEGTHFAGTQPRASIISRRSVGPSAFAFDPHDALLTNTSGRVPTTALLDFPLSKMLYDKAIYGENPVIDDILYNNNGQNTLWNILTGAAFGFVVPGTDTYMTIGGLGGLTSKIGYKQLQNNGNRCGGPCAYDPTDVHHYYWLWNLHDLYQAKLGLVDPSDIRPYQYGKFAIPVDLGLSTASSGAFDKATNTLYLSFSGADKLTRYNELPVFLAFKVRVDD